MKAKFIFTFIITLILLYIPVVSNVFKSLNTMFHEVGHALMTLVTVGKVESISLFYNTEGVTMSLTSSWISSFLISISGYLFTSIVVLLCCFLWKKKLFKTMLLFLSVFTLVSLVLWVRNPYGIIWSIGMILLFFLLFKIKEKYTLEIILFIFVGILFTQNLDSAFDIFMLSYFTPEAAGDATILSNLTKIPSIVFGILFMIQSIIFSFVSLVLLFKKEKRYGV